MCEHRQPHDVEDCTLELDPSSGRLVCVQHVQPVSRQRRDEALAVAVMQREATP